MDADYSRRSLVNALRRQRRDLRRGVNALGVVEDSEEPVGPGAEPRAPASPVRAPPSAATIQGLTESPVRPRQRRRRTEVPMGSPGSALEMPPPVYPASLLSSPVRAAKAQPQAKKARRALYLPPLPLPESYSNLEAMFQAIETTCTLRQSRKMHCTFDVVKEAVETMTRIRFSEKHLGQIFRVWGDAFAVQVRRLPRMVRGIERLEHQYVVESTAIQAVNNSGDAQSLPSSSEFSDGSVLVPVSTINQRRAEFRKRLEERVREHHAAFLETLEDPPNVDPATVRTWHKDFGLDTVPEIPPLELPALPDAVLSRDNVDLLLAQSRAATPRIAEAVRGTLARSDLAGAAAPATSSSYGSSAQSRSTSGLSASLLAHVRSREKRRLEDAAEGGQAFEDKRAIESERMRNVADALRAYMRTEKKTAFPLDTIVERIASNARLLLHSREVRAALEALTKRVPEWAHIKPIGGTMYIKLSKTVDYSEVRAQLCE